MSVTRAFGVRLVCALIGVSVLVGCAAAVGGGGSAPLPPGSCPSRLANKDSHTIIDWAPFVVVDGVTFTTNYSDESVLAKKDIGPVVATVRCRIEGAVDDPEFRPRDGDAAFLAVGTQLHAVVGAPSTRLAAREDGVWRLYKANDSTPEK